MMTARASSVYCYRLSAEPSMRPTAIPARAALACMFVLVSASALGEYPDRPIRLIISSAAGGSPDVVTRILAAELVKQMGQQIVIDNRPGAAQTLGTEMVVRSTP